MRHLFDLEMLDAILRGTISPEMILALSEGEVTDADDVVKGFGHIELNMPVCLPACRRRLALLLDMSDDLLDSLLLSWSCLVTDPGPADFKPGQIIPIMGNLRVLDRHSREMGLLSGAEAVMHLLGQVDLDRLSGELSDALALTDPTREPRRCSRLIERLMAVEYYRISRFDPLWSFLLYLPVVPSALRPEPPDPPRDGDGGEAAAPEDEELDRGVRSQTAYNEFRRACCQREHCSWVIPDLDTHYRTLLNRNRRLARIRKMDGIPCVVILHEKMELQKAVNCLIDNKNQYEPVTDICGRALESLAEMICCLQSDPWNPGT